ncbi:MAG: hypothetical protein RQ842_09855 [Vulcanisaeta sp.]|nr:hypothetical protein [Vulcanisaeta sp.]
MSRKSKKKSEEEKTSGSASITSFLYGTEEQQAKTSAGTKPTETKPIETRKEEATEEKPRTEGVAKEYTKPAASGVEGEILNHIMSRGSVTKDELMAWAKSRGYRISDVLRAIESLTGSGKVRKRLNDKGNLIYVYVKQ